MQFNQLVNGIQHLHQELHQQVAHAVNVGLTVRNWLVGYYIERIIQSIKDKRLFKILFSRI